MWHGCKKNIKLSSNLDCVNTDGLIVLGNDLTIDLNGFDIIGPGIKSSKVGLSILGGFHLYNTDSGPLENIKITGNGEISNFQSGIMVTESKNINISSLNLTNNEIGIFLKDVKKSRVANSTFDRNSIGSALHNSMNIKIEHNSLSLNDLAGITAVSSSDNTISNNEISKSVNGIFLDKDSENNVVDSNVLGNNRGVDLNYSNGLQDMNNDNTFINNECNTSAPSGLCG